MKVQQGSVFFNNLLRDVKAGNLAPASFQRPYVWQKSDVLAFIESILRGYPVGAFLFWSPYGKADLSKVSRTRLGPVLASGSENRAALLLDGQNRLATLAWLCFDYAEPLPSDLSDTEAATWASSERLVIDLEAQALRYVPVAEASAGLRLPTAALLDSQLALPLIRKKWSTDWADYSDDAKDDALRWFDECSYAFREAQVTYADIQGATVDEARDAFLHICRVGVPMSPADFEAAVAWALPTP